MRYFLLGIVLLSSCFSGLRVSDAFGGKAYASQEVSTKPVAGEHYVPKISLDGEVNDESVDAVLTLMQAVVDNHAEAIILEINTPGGSVDAGFKLAKYMENSPVPIVCVVDQEAASMGFYLLQSCTVRTMTKRSILMAHEPAIRGGGAGDGHENSWRSIAEVLHAMSRAMAEHMTHRMNISADVMMEHISGSKMWWFTWIDALQFKAVDGVVNSVEEVTMSMRKDFATPPMLTELPVQQSSSH